MSDTSTSPDGAKPQEGPDPHSDPLAVSLAIEREKLKLERERILLERERLETAKIASALKGFPISLVIAGLMSLAFLGFSNMFAGVM